MNIFSLLTIMQAIISIARRLKNPGQTLRGRTTNPKPRGAAALLSGGAAVAPPRRHLNSSRSRQLEGIKYYVNDYLTHEAKSV